jgi:thiol:disulfide interchange protein
MFELLTYIGAGLLGGLILNVMPCVLPVLFFKVHGWVNQGDVSPSHRKKEALAFLAGVLVCFSILALVVEGVRQAGESMIWGEQMSSPGFVMCIVILLFVFGLNALGVFEFSFSMGGTGGAQGGLWASFSHGALITLVSTPCSAPILGAATTAALAQSAMWYETLVLFWSIGVGLSAPVLLVGFVPAAHKLLPRPGGWMNGFKSFVGFTLLGAAVFFLDALQAQLPKSSVSGLLYFLTALSLTLVVYEGTRIRFEGIRRLFMLVVLVSFLASSGWYLLDTTPSNPAASSGSVQTAGSGEVDWVAFRAESETVASTLAWAKAENRAVFVDFTADWCVNCKAFEKAYIDTQAMAKVFASTNVIAAKADYTRKDPPLRAMLKTLGRSGLPTYAIYFPDGSFDLLPNGPPLTLESRLNAAFEKLSK